MGEQRGSSRSAVASGRPTRVGSIGCAAGVAVLMLVGLAGCGSDAPNPPSAFPSATSVSPTSTSTPTSDRAKVEQTVRDYYAAMDVAIRTGDTRSFEVVTTRDCACRELVRDVRQVFRSGSTSGAGVALVKSAVPVAVNRNLFDIETVARVSAYDEISSEGRVRRHFRAHDDRRLLSVVRSGNAFVVGDVLYEGRAA